MPEFEYEAMSATGATLTGRLDAPSETAALDRLAAQGHYPIAVRPVRTKAGQSKRTGSWLGGLRLPMVPGMWADGLRRSDMLSLTRDLAHMLRAGLTLDEALRVLASGDPGAERVTATARQVGESLRGGASLSDALERHGPPFDALYVSLVRAGETAGALGVTLDRLADHLTRMAALRSAVGLALVYPAALLLATILSVAVLMTTVVPRFEALFAQSGTELPLSTQIVTSLAQGLSDSGPLLLLGVLLAVLAGRRLIQVPRHRRRLDDLLLGVPLTGGIVRRVALARFARALGLMLGNGVDMLTAYSHALAAVGNAALRHRLEAVVEPLRAGQGLAGPLRDARVLPGAGAQLVRVAKETGRLGPLLLDLADLYEGQAQDQIKRLLAVLEPAIILVLGLLVGGIVLSLFAAITELQDVAF